MIRLERMSDLEKMIYYFEMYKKAMQCHREAEAIYFLQQAQFYQNASQVVETENVVEE